MFGLSLLSVLQSPIALLFGAAVLAIGGALGLEFVLRLKRHALAGRMALIAPWTKTVEPVVSRTTAAASQARHGPVEQLIARLLPPLGLPSSRAAALRPVILPLAAVVFCVGAWFLVPLLIPATTGIVALRMLLAASAGFLGWFLPAITAAWAVARHRDAVVAGLPDALELLVICAEGGLALADGIDRIVEELRRAQPELAEELARTAADLKILPSQDQALAGLAARIDAPVVRSMVTSLSQTMRYGTPLAQAMRVVAADLRSESLLRMEERVNRLPALLTIPMILFILPTIMLIAGGPAALRIIDLLPH
ncbi:MAG: type II secretion system F family protein [Devosia sp.]|nr:type II secretion system F family protein [Devosia sp.]